MFKKYDLSGDDELDFKEFSLMFIQKQGPDAAPAYKGLKSDPYAQEKKKQELSMASNNFEHPDNLQDLFK